MWVPYPIISLVTRLAQSLHGFAPLAFRTRTFDTFTLTFAREKEAVDVFDSIKELTVITRIDQLYAFDYQPKPPLDTQDGWNVYNPRDELARMGLGSRTKAWRFTDINKDYSFCPTYPARLAVPTRISDTTLAYAAKYRSKARIPALVYLHWANYTIIYQASITRSSQPMVGLTNNRSIQDEKLIEAIFQSHLSAESVFVSPIGESPRPRAGAVYGATATNLIIDARPTANAMVMSVKGAGTENMDYYKDGKKVYLGVDNIHVMRESLSKVADALRDADQMTAVHGKDEGGSFLDRQALRRSGWLKHISAILEGTLIIVKNVHINSSHVLIHCSDGWDRTAQLSSLSQLCLDPFYRTIRGFQVLVEKDWLSFGHRFADRCGHLSSEKFFTTASGDTQGGGGGADAATAFLASMQNKFTPQSHVKETSPVFHQFLECVRQMQRQHPTRFEFNQEYLQRLHYHLYSCQFGTFLWNNERERRVAEDISGVPCERTYSIWDFLNSSSELSKFRNPDYDILLDDRTSRAVDADMGVLAIDPKDVKFWHELYGRTDEEMNGRFLLPQTTGPELVGPIDGDDIDPVRGVVQAFADTALPPRASIPPSPSLSTAQVPVPDRQRDDPRFRSHSPSFLPTADGSNSESVSLSSGVPGRSTPLRGAEPRSSPNSGSGMSPSQRRPLSSDPMSSARRTTGSLTDERAPLPVPNFKNMWASFSSNAGAALTAVQGAYEGATKDLRVPETIGGFSARFATSSTGFGGSVSGEMEEKSSLSASTSTGGRGWGDELEEGSPWAGMTTRQARSELSENPWATSDSSTIRDYPSKPAAVRSPGSASQSWSSETSASLDPSSTRRSTLEPSYLDPTIESLAGLSLSTKPTGMVKSGVQKPSSSISSLSPTVMAESAGSNAASNAESDSDPLGVGFLR